MVQVALVIPKAIGGVKTVTIKLFRGLLLEGFDVKLIKLQDINLATTWFSDLLNTKNFEKFDVVIFMGNIPWPSHLFLKKPVIASFLHGFVHCELFNAAMHGKLRVNLGAMSLLGYWKLVRGINKVLNKIDFFICHSGTSCEKNGVYGNCILLPQFILPEEVELYTSLVENFHKCAPRKKMIKVLAYGSFADSPRLLSDPHIILLMKRVSEQVNEDIELVIVDPKTTGRNVERRGKLIIQRVGRMHKEQFLRFLANSDLFIERCIDEELRYATLEAGLLEIPIAKITHPKYIVRQDYTEDHMLLANSFEELVYKLAKYIKHKEDFNPYYSKKMKEFITTRRIWNAVKDPLIRRLMRC
jgi:hypothetical protein